MGNLANCRENTRCTARSLVSGVNHSRRSRPAIAGWNRHESASKLSAPTAIQGGDAVADERPSELSDAVADRKRGRSLEDMHETLDASGSGVKEALFSDDLFPLPLSVDGVGITDWPRLPERTQVGFLRQKELQERLLLKAAGLGDGKQQQIVTGRPLEERSRDLPLHGQLSEHLSAMLFSQGIPSSFRNVKRLSR